MNGDNEVIYALTDAGKAVHLAFSAVEEFLIENPNHSHYWLDVIKDMVVMKAVSDRAIKSATATKTVPFIPVL